jgi:hypothetical protein
MTEKKSDQSKISLASLTFEEALKGLLVMPPPPKEPKPNEGCVRGVLYFPPRYPHSSFPSAARSR